MKPAKGLNVTMNKGLISGVLYQTEIVKIHDGLLTLRNGGWKTMHTKKCINRILSFYEIEAQVFQKDFEWYVSLNGTTTSFQDGMQVNFNYKYEVA